MEIEEGEVLIFELGLKGGRKEDPLLAPDDVEAPRERTKHVGVQRRPTALGADINESIVIFCFTEAVLLQKIGLEVRWDVVKRVAEFLLVLAPQMPIFRVEERLFRALHVFAIRFEL